MLVVWILLHRMEQSNLVLLIGGERVIRVVPLTIIKLNFFDDSVHLVLHGLLILTNHFGVIDEVRLLRIH